MTKRQKTAFNKAVKHLATNETVCVEARTNRGNTIDLQVYTNDQIDLVKKFCSTYAFVFVDPVDEFDF